MGIFDSMKQSMDIRKAIAKHQKGDIEGAFADYETFYKAGIMDARYLLPYTILIIRKGGTENYEKAKDILRKLDKMPGIEADKKQQIHLNYAVAQYKLGNLEQAIHLLESSHKKNPCELTFGALGFIYIEAGDVEKGLSFNLEALEYDDEDPVVLDNLGQYYYRVINDKEKALPYFQKAHQIKETQIDTLYFLAQYDLENGDKEAAIEKLETASEGRFSPLNYVTKEIIEKHIETLKA